MGASSLLNVHASPAECEADGSEKCPLCGGATRLWMTVPGDWRRPQSHEAFDLGWCDACEYGLLLTRPTPQRLAEFYRVDDYYTHHSPNQVAAARSLFDRLRVRLAWSTEKPGVEAELDARSLRRQGVTDGASVCDVGCGNGGTLTRLAAAGYCVTGIEPDADALHTARANGLRVLAGSGEQLPDLDGERFDVVTMMHVLEHCLDPVTAVRNLASLLNDDGLFIVETPNNACEGLRRAGATWHWLDVPRHLNFFTSHSLVAVCEQAGLSIRAVEYTGYTRQFQPAWIAQEQFIHERLAAMTPNAASLPAPNSSLRAFKLWAATRNTSAERKFDSVRVIASKRG